MCGLAGVIAWDDRYRADRAALGRMSARIAHRGPDAEGIWESPAALHVGLVHRRLAIIDLDPRANQPFAGAQGRHLLFNGEIYNYRELRRELESLRPEYPWRTQSDTEVLLAAYAAWGDKCVEKLNGMFAFAIWDQAKSELFLARDRMGQKPLYVALVSAGRAVNLDDHNAPIDAVAFASELPALRECGFVSQSVSDRGLIEYLSRGYLSAPLTIYNDAHELPPGHTLRVRRDGVSTHEYFSAGPALSTQPPTLDAEAITATRDHVTRAVARQMVADVPIGCFLSGGVDSSIIAASMKRALAPGQPLHTFSIGFDDPRYDETQYARQVARHLGSEHHAFTVRPDAAEDLPKLAATFGEPFGDSSALPTHYLARETRQHVKVALSGDGGDELFGGYDRYRAVHLAQTVRRLTTPLPWAVLAPLVARLPAGHPKSRWHRAARFARSLADPDDRRYAGYLAIFNDDLLRQLLPDRPAYPLSPSLFANLNVVRSALACDRVDYLPFDLLTKVDRCSMLHALEVRSPFMDHDLVGHAAALTTPQLLRGGSKRMLREAFAPDLPAWVFRRKKMGFAVPVGDWLRTDLRPMLHDHLFAAVSFGTAHFNQPFLRRLVTEHESGRVDHTHRLYALLMLELWHRTI